MALGAACGGGRVSPAEILHLRDGERVREGDYPAGFMESLNRRLDAIAAEVDEETQEVCS